MLKELIQVTDHWGNQTNLLLIEEKQSKMLHSLRKPNLNLQLVEKTNPNSRFNIEKTNQTDAHLRDSPRCLKQLKLLFICCLRKNNPNCCLFRKYKPNCHFKLLVYFLENWSMMVINNFAFELRNSASWWWLE